MVPALVACGSAKDASKSNFSQAIQAWLDTQKGLCAAVPGKQLPFTQSKKDWGLPNEKWADALADAGLLSRKDVEVKGMFGKPEAGTEYGITDLGKQYLVPDGAGTIGKHDAFCSGKYEMVDVDTFTEPSDAMGATVSQVNYRYKVDDAADWAKSEGIRAAYAHFKEQAEGEIQGKAVLILTNEGWLHEKLFKR